MPDLHISPTDTVRQELDEDGTPGLVSVIVPMYNHARYVRQLLDSIAADDYPDIEVLVLDDGSSDDSFDAASAWGEAGAASFRRFMLLRQQNMGVTKTFNKLIRLSAGEFIVPIASDDVLLNGGIRARVEALRRHPKWLAVFGDCTIIDQNGDTSRESALRDFFGHDKAVFLSPYTMKVELTWNFGMPGPGLMVRRRAYADSGEIGLYDETLQQEDTSFYLKALALNGIGFIDLPVASYRIHGRNLSKPGNMSKLLPLLAATASGPERQLAGRFDWLCRMGIRSRSWRTLKHMESHQRSSLPSALKFFLARAVHRAGATVVLGVNARMSHLLAHRRKAKQAAFVAHDAGPL